MYSDIYLALISLNQYKHVSTILYNKYQKGDIYHINRLIYIYIYIHFAIYTNQKGISPVKKSVLLMKTTLSRGIRVI